MQVQTIYKHTVRTTPASHHTTDGSGTGPFVSHLTALSPGTTYYYRAYATNATRSKQPIIAIWCNFFNLIFCIWCKFCIFAKLNLVQ
jgi:hypothetical protein